MTIHERTGADPRQKRYRMKDGEPQHHGDCAIFAYEVCTCGLLHDYSPIEDVPASIRSQQVVHDSVLAGLDLIKSPKPVLTAAEIEAFENLVVVAEKFSTALKNTSPELAPCLNMAITARAAMARLKAGGNQTAAEAIDETAARRFKARVSRRSHQPTVEQQHKVYGGETKTEEAKPIDTGEADKIIDKMLGECNCNEGFGPSCE